MNRKPVRIAISMVARCRTEDGLLVVFTEALRLTKRRLEGYRCLPQVRRQDSSEIFVFGLRKRRR
jgi:hypothetical protein